MGLTNTQQCIAKVAEGSATLAKTGIKNPKKLQLEHFLSELEAYGNPRLRKSNGEWYCGIDVFVTGEGTEFSVRSNFKHKTPVEACALCLDRLMAEISKIKNCNEA